MSNAIGTSKDALQKLIDIHDGAPRIALKASQLPNVSSKAQKVVALLLSPSLGTITTMRPKFSSRSARRSASG